MNTILVRSLAIGISSILSFALVTMAVITFGMQGVLADWEDSNNRLLVTTLGERLQAIADTQGLPAPDQATLAALLQENLGSLPVKADFVAVVDAENTPLYLNRDGGTPPGQGRNMFARLQGSAIWHEIRSGGQLWFRFAAQVRPFDADESNRILFSALRLTALWGTAAACLIAFLLAYLLSRPLSRQARALAGALQALQGGQRGITIPAGGVRELDDIAKSTRNLQDSLRQEEGLRQQWAADIAHDLRTPLTVLKGQFEGMIDGVFQADRPRLERNYQEILHLERLIAQLSELTRLETPGFRIQARELDAGALLRSLAARFADAAAARGCRIETPPPESESCLIQADAALLERALTNLVDNALRHGQPGNTVRLGMVQAEEETVAFEVENAGLIDEAALPHLFDRLFRADSSRNSPGSGLGLAIVKAIALAHRGSVAVHSDAAKGRTVFNLTIPGART